MFKFIYKKFSKSVTLNSLNKYKKLIHDSEYIVEDLFPKKILDRQHFMDYAKLNSITHNITLKGNTQIDSINMSVFNPCWDLLNRGGKKWRPIFGLILADYYNININDIKKYAFLYKLLALTELIHNASLIIDDVEDKSEQRRDKPCVHIKYGEDIAINAGISMLYFPMYKLVQEISDPIMRDKISNIYFEEMTVIHLGQAWDIEMKVNRRLPSLENYIDTVLCKTGVCLRLIAKMIHAAVNNTEDLKIMIDIADNISIAFQIKDDLLNITDSTLSKGKGFIGEDIYEGKLTLMVLHSLEKHNKNRLREILTMKTKDQMLINEAIDIMKKNKSIEYATDIMNEHVKIVFQKCENLKEKKNYNIEAVNNLIQLVNYLIDRNI